MCIRDSSKLLERALHKTHAIGVPRIGDRPLCQRDRVGVAIEPGKCDLRVLCGELRKAVSCTARQFEN